MQIIRHIDDPALAFEGSSVTLGNFDGIHLGHQELIKNTVDDARRLGVCSAVLTFEPHPLRVLAPDRAPKMLLTHKDKMQLLQALGVDCVVIQQFDRAFAAIPAQEFVRKYLRERLHARKVWVGKDLRFGKGRGGDIENLRAWGAQLEYAVGIVEPVMVAGERVSSSRIRELIVAGAVAAVQPMLARYYFISGKVVPGHRRGRELGFPTANIVSRAEIVPRDGIYATLFHLGEKVLPSVTSVGLNPTFGAGPRTVESYILHFDRDIYGESVQVSFVARLRDELNFASVTSLIEQIQVDIADAEKILAVQGFLSTI
ncbi:MAG: bifunctional riboflavin kinase/FAD synthetase [Candidatus Binatia bacterium]